MLKSFIQWLLILSLAGIPMVAQAANKLEHHPSPYLAMHAGDPVNWQLWNEDVFKQAREQNKLIFVSVGYFSCHWCHVMQRESYQDKSVAETLNSHFLSVKVDRELRPELDRRLIDFVSRVRGNAGWPLHVFLTPDGYPVTGFTYLPREVFNDVILQLQQQWLTRQDEIKEAAQKYYLASLADDKGNQLLESSGINVEALANAFIAQALQVADELQGGFGDAGKFPQFPQLFSLLQLVGQGGFNHPELSDFIHLSLREMAGRHLMDHINGGFFRYTTDPDWQTPHYEKMLYDNAQMVLLYLQAEQQWPDRGYGEVAENTLDFIQTHMKHPQGGYVSSISAVDGNGREGGGYLWRREELKRTLGEDDFEYIAGIWQLGAPMADGDFLLQPLVGLTAQGDLKRNRQIKKQLQRVVKAVMPIDSKRLASWNALVLQALVAAARYDKNYRATAEEQYEFMMQAFIDRGRLVRFAGNQALAESTFEDLAFVANAFQQYGDLVSDGGAIDQARLLASNAYQRFNRNGKWETSEQSLLPNSVGHWLLKDSAITSPLTQWLEVALKLPKSQVQLPAESLDTIYRVTRNMIDRPYYYGSLIALRHRQAE